MSKRILLVEDDRDLSCALVHILQREGYGVDAVFDGVSGYEYAQSGIYDAIIFDVMLPQMSGMDAVGKLRNAGIMTPVLMLTAKGTVADKIEGLDGGADSYMTKPFSSNELLARLRSLTRRYVNEAQSDISVGDLKLISATRSLSFGDESFQLCNKEYLLAELLMSNPSIVMTDRRIVDAVWGAGAEVDDNSIEAYVSMLRKKLKFLDAGVRISRERNVGYSLEKMPAS